MIFNRTQTLNQISDILLNIPQADLPLLVGIDGVDGAGKTVLADELSILLQSRSQRQIVRVSLDGFHNPRAIRYQRGRDCPEGFYLDSYNYERFRACVVKPLKAGGSRQITVEIFDCDNDRAVDRQDTQASDQAIVLVDGIFLHRPELENVWDFSIFVKTAFEVSVPRGNARFDLDLDPDPKALSNARYVKGQQLYLSACQPELNASLLVDNNILEFAHIITKPRFEVKGQPS